MKNGALVGITTVRLTMIVAMVLAGSGLGTAAVKKKVPVAQPSSKSASRSKTARTGRKRSVAAASRSRKRGKASAQSWRNRQSAPSSDRYKEIQRALAAKGYLRSEPNGIWDSQSQDAMKQFQTDQKLSPTGKINSPSLIGLGLGPRQIAPVPNPPASPSATGENPLMPE